MERLPDWSVRLRAWLISIHGRPIQPGHHDCCLFGAGAIEAQTGIDLAADWRGRYSTFVGGRRVLRQAGYADHVALIATHLREAPVIEACEGDIAILPTGDGDAVGVVQGAAVYVLAQTGRIGLAPMTAAHRLFKLGA